MNEKYQGSDISVNHNNATVANTTYTDGPFAAGRRAYRFRQTGDSYIHIPQSAAFTLNSSFTILFYASPNGKKGRLLEYSVNGRLGIAIRLFLTELDIIVTMFHSRMYIDINVQANDWYFFGVSADISTGVVSAWMDSELIGNHSTEPEKVKKFTSMETYLGFSQYDNSYWRGGAVACLMIYADELSRDQMRQARHQCVKMECEDG